MRDQGDLFQKDTAQATTPGHLLPAGRQELLERVMSLNRLAETMQSAGRVRRDSEPLYGQAFDLCRDLSSQDSNTGVILNNLAELY